MKEFVVAEVSTSWPKSAADKTILDNAPAGYVMPLLLAERFEDVVNVNFDRGYDLVDWRFTSVIRPRPIPSGPTNMHIETIIAVFRLRKATP